VEDDDCETAALADEVAANTDSVRATARGSTRTCGAAAWLRAARLREAAKPDAEMQPPDAATVPALAAAEPDAENARSLGASPARASNPRPLATKCFRDKSWLTGRLVQTKGAQRQPIDFSKVNPKFYYLYQAPLIISIT